MNLERLFNMQLALKGTPDEEAAKKLYRKAFDAAHSHPRQNKVVRAAFSKLRTKCIKRGVWERLKQDA